MSAPLAITAGDPAGIGPDLLLALPDALPGVPVVAIADRQVLAERAEQLRLAVPLSDWQPGQALPQPGLAVYHQPMARVVRAGVADPANAGAILACLDRAMDGCHDGTFAAMVTAPLAKHVIRDGSDRNFTGHTEYLCQRAGCDQVVMMLSAGTLRVALATTHLPLRQVADAINAESLTAVLRILDQSLRHDFAIAEPSILVLGLNPHAGENGHLGDEEQRIIAPTLAHLRQQGLTLSGPLPADTAFTPHQLAGHHAVLAMYHDQGLPVLKYAGFGAAVNITLGLPFIRTSVDHGTAFALAGSGRAEPGSLIAACQLAWQLANSRGRQ